MSYTSFALKKKFINHFFYYLSLIIFLSSSIGFIYYYFQNAENINNDISNIRKDIILCFLFNFILNECTMIMSIFYNIIGKNNRFGEKLLKDIKSLSVFFAGLFFVLIQCIMAIISTKYDNKQIENYIYYIIFTCFIIIILLISIIFL